MVYQQNINACTRLAVWHINEDESFFLSTVPIQQAISHPQKRLQHLAGRLLLPLLFENFPLKLIQIADTRKPFLPGEPYHFSISHCGDYAAAIVSTENRVGVDVEIPHPKILNIINKFLDAEEQQLLRTQASEAIHVFTMAWSVKETLFKWYGDGEVDFKRHMHIANFKLVDNQFTAYCIFSKDEPLELKVHGLFFNGNSLAWIAT